ncbi:MAG: hypothetical protein R3321_11830, partial [Nitrososphaeraceae archaeon]|nr:hypothetical protein [Nitrososphaeraceae archaeon]
MNNKTIVIGVIAFSILLLFNIFSITNYSYSQNDDEDDQVPTGEIPKPKVSVAIEGTANDDKIKGGSGDDELFGNEGNDVLEGADGNDEIEGGEGDDTLKGGKGEDKIEGGPGNDVLKGENDDD